MEDPRDSRLKTQDIAMLDSTVAEVSKSQLKLHGERWNRKRRKKWVMCETVIFQYKVQVCKICCMFYSACCVIWRRDKNIPCMFVHFLAVYCFTHVDFGFSHMYNMDFAWTFVICDLIKKMKREERKTDRERDRERVLSTKCSRCNV